MISYVNCSSGRAGLKGAGAFSGERSFYKLKLIESRPEHP